MSLAPVGRRWRSLVAVILLAALAAVAVAMVASDAPSSTADAYAGHHEAASRPGVTPQARIERLLHGARLVPRLSTATTRTYRRPDGTFLSRVFAMRPARARLRRGEHGFSADSGPWTTTLPKTLRAPVRVRRGKAWLSMQLRGAVGTARVDGTSVAYADALPGATVEYTVTAGSVSEQIHLHGTGPPAPLVFDLRASAGLHAVARRNGAIALQDRHRRDVLALAPSFAFRDAAPGAHHAVATTLAATKAGWRVTLTPDRRWLTAALRRGPVTIDPTVELQGATQDCALSSDLPNSSYCSNSGLWVGWSGDHDHHTLIKWDLGSIPKDAVAISGDFGLYQADPSASVAKTLTLHRLTRSWTNSASWNRYDGSHAWTTPGGDFDPAPIASATIPASTTGWTDWFDSELVQGWIDGSIDNYGILVREQPGPLVAGEEDFAATEGHIAASAPELDIVWSPRTGEPDAYTFERQSLGGGVDIAVNPANGNLLAGTKAVSVPGTGVDLRIDHYHNSLASGTELQGTGIRGTASLGRDVHLRAVDDHSVAFFRGDGLAVVFRHAQTTGTTIAYDSPYELADATLAKDTSANRWTLSLPGGLPAYPGVPLTLTFGGADGRLLTLADAAGHTIAFSYYSDGGTEIPALHGITDTNSTNYVAVRNYIDDGYLQDLTGPGTQAWHWTYASTNTDYLTQFTAPGGVVVKYAYDSSHRLKSITTPDGNVTLITYSGTSSKVATIVRTDNAAHTTGPTTTFTYDTVAAPCVTGSYDLAKTTVARPDGSSTTYCANRRDQITYDSDAPTASPSGDWRDRHDSYVSGSGTHAIALHGTDAAAGVKTLALEQVGGTTLASKTLTCDPRTLSAPTACPRSADAALTFDVAGIAEGSHDYRQVTTDVAGNTGASPSWTVKVDRTPGPVPSDLHVESYNSTTGVARIAWDPHADPALADGTAGSGLDHAQFRYRRAGGDWTEWATADALGHFDLPDASTGQPVTVQVRTVDAVGNASDNASLDATVGTSAPANTTAPSISGTPTDGQELTADDGEWTGTEPIAYARQWQRCDATGSDCVPVPGATDDTYTLTPDDVGARLRVAITASNAVASVTATSAPTAVVDALPPANTELPTITGSAVEGHTLTAHAGTWQGTAPLTFTYRWRRCAADGTGCSNIAGATDATYIVTTADVGSALRVAVTATNAAGADTSESEATAVTAGAVAAPDLPRHETTDVGDASSFLYTGDNPVQEGVAAGTIVHQRAAVVRGRVLDADGAPLAGVTASVVDHPELGSMTTAADGEVYLAVNGGGRLRVRLQRAGDLPAERQVDVPWQDYAWFDDVRLLPLDAHVTDVDLSSPLAPAQVARGSEEADDAGTRRATLLFGAGTQASMTLPGGGSLPLSHLNVRATEYTVGPHGDEAMPASLPPTSAYTYAVDYTVDEALAAGATEVTFDKPVATYTDNFIGFDVGARVPVGYYDAQRGAWVPSDDGRVVEVLSESGGVATLDVDGDGEPATTAELDELGVTDDELAQVADLYQPGDTLWRVAVTHFTPYDYNAGVWYPPGARNPDGSPITGLGAGGGGCASGGSVIGCDDQTLGEDVALTGTSAGLHYRSDRAPGRVVGNTMELQVTPDDPGPLRRAQMTIDVAGQRIVRQFDNQAGQFSKFTWDGKDGFGREVTGAAEAKVRLTWIYPSLYALDDSSGGRAFAQAGGSPTDIPSRMEGGMDETFSVTLGGEDEASDDLGGWTLDGHNSYDPTAKVLHLGDGSQVSTEEVGASITRTAGDPSSVPVNSRPSSARRDPGDPDDWGDGGPAKDALFLGLGGGAAGPDGSLYLADTGHHRVRRIAPDGTISTFAGGGDPGPDDADAGDGGPATDAYINWPLDVAVGPDGTVYVAARGSVRAVGTDGIIRTVAGTGELGGTPSGDGGPATAAVLSANTIAVAPDGTLYVVDFSHHQIRRVTPDGIISRFAGTGTSGYSGDDGPAVDAKLNYPSGVAVGQDGGVYIADSSNHRVRRVGVDGVIATVAGDGTPGRSGNGLPGTQARLQYPSTVSVAQDGTVYIGESGDIRRLDASGVISVLAGGGSQNPGAGGVAGAARIECPSAVIPMPDGGSTYVTNGCDASLYRVGPALPGAGADGYTIPSPDGTAIFQFDRHGRQTRTLNARTGTVAGTFAYDGAGRLTSITDGDGNQTQVERASDGHPTAIVGPFGQRTALDLDAHGWLSGVEDPNGHTTSMTTSSDGLLSSFQSPRGAASTFDYDDEGRLTNDADAVGGAKSFARTTHNGGATVTMTTAGGHASSYALTRDLQGVTKRGYTSPQGLVGGTTRGTDGVLTRTLPDGSTVTNARAADPQFGLAAPVTSGSVSTPGGRSYSVTTSRDTELSDADNPLSLATADDEASINGKTWTAHFARGSLTQTTTSPEGRTTTATIDAQGRPTELDVPGVLPTHNEYDGHGQLSGSTQGDRTTTYDHNAQGLVSEIHAPLSAVTVFDYDLGGRLTSSTLPGGATTTYTYDDDGNATSIMPPGRPAHHFTSTAVGLPATYTAPDVGDGATPVEWHYDTDRRLMSVDRADGTSLDYSYTSSGALQELASGDDTIQYHYNMSKGQVTSIDASTGETLSFGYDGGLATQDTLTGPVAGSVSRTFDDDLRVTRVAVDGGAAADYDYDDDGLLVQAGSLTVARDSTTGLATGTAAGAVATTSTRNGYGEPSAWSASASGTPLLSEALTRDDAGRIVEADEADGSGTVHRTYGYDDAGHLEDVHQDGDLVAHYAYDANGNRTSVTTAGGTRTATYDDQDRLTGDGDVTFSYDKNGQLTRREDGSAVTTYAYNVFGALNGAELSDGRHVSYVLDGQNRRVGKRVDGDLVEGFLYGKALNPVAELNADGSVRSTFVYGNDNVVPSLMVRGGTTYRLVSDERGSVRLVVDADTGAVAQRIDYDAFGRITLDTSPGFQPFGYGGGLYDADTGLTLLGQRNYDAETGRFTSKDPEGFAAGDTNLYAYAFGDPIDLGDPTGDGLGDFVGSAFSGFSSGVSSAASSFGNAVSTVANAAPNIVAGAMDGLTGGLSTQIAGHLLGFDPACADFGSTFHVASNLAFAASTFTGFGAERDAIAWTWKTRKALGADGGISRVGVERMNGEAISQAHVVTVDDQVVHQHQTHLGKYGGSRQFPNEWIEHPDVGAH